MQAKSQFLVCRTHIPSISSMLALFLTQDFSVSCTFIKLVS